MSAPRVTRSVQISHGAAAASAALAIYFNRACTLCGMCDGGRKAEGPGAGDGGRNRTGAGAVNQRLMTRSPCRRYARLTATCPFRARHSRRGGIPLPKIDINMCSTFESTRDTICCIQKPCLIRIPRRCRADTVSAGVDRHYTLPSRPPPRPDTKIVNDSLPAVQRAVTNFRLSPADGFVRPRAVVD
ncbi:hypothetical protein EVAR_58492_1 [Eumeta japonica]|uniref:Uncharacterized protein n=1 Tax=Eumeta variegata TaxID=151549 RepID=A0A4C1ZJZ3_EUMVA|nr:hypothetical protein EVAR_58492_1 [Eumeta japonica]